jgi:hypothetical protein
MPFAYEFAGGAEISLDGKVYDGITNVSLEQPTEREAIFGTKRKPLAFTKGRLSGLGDGSVEWTDLEQYMDFIARMAEQGAYREVPFVVTAVFTCEGKPSQRKTAYECMLTNEPMGNDPGLGGEMAFTFSGMTINGQSPHS